MKLTAASDTNRPSTCLHYQQPSERTLTKRAGLQATSAVERIGKTRRNSRNSRNENQYSPWCNQSDLISENARKKGIQTNLTSNNTRYTPERAASTDTLSAEPPKEQHHLKNQKEHHLSKEQHQGPGCLQTSVYMKQNVLKSFPGVA